MPPFPSLSINYVAPALLPNGEDAVLKLGIPRHEFMNEMEALRLYEGDGIVKLLAEDADLGAMLLERLKPGASLSNVPDEEKATSIAAQLMRRLRRPPPRELHFPKVSDWATGLGNLRKRFEGETGPIPAPLVQRAETLFPELIGTMDSSTETCTTKISFWRSGSLGWP